MPLVHLTDLISKPDNTYAIGAFNVSDMEMAMGAIKAAEELEAPLILQIAEGRLRYSPLDLLGAGPVAGPRAFCRQSGAPAAGTPAHQTRTRPRLYVRHV